MSTINPASTSAPRTILVTGATGSQGGAVLRSLQAARAKEGASAFEILALTRNPSSEKAQALSKLDNVRVVKGDLADPASLKTALQGVDTALLVTDAYGKGGAAAEKVQGINFVDAAKEAGVDYVVFNSVGSADIGDSVPHFASKWVIEQHLHSKFSTNQWSVIRPVAYFDNVPIQKGGIAQYMTLGIFAAGLQGKSLKFISVKDIGEVSAQALLHRDSFAGKTVELLGDEITVDQLQESIGRAQGKSKVGRAYVPGFLASAMLPTEMTAMFKWFRETGYRGTVEEVKAIHPQIQNADAWAKDLLANKA